MKLAINTYITEEAPLASWGIGEMIWRITGHSKYGGYDMVLVKTADPVHSPIGTKTYGYNLPVDIEIVSLPILPTITKETCNVLMSYHCDRLNQQREWCEKQGKWIPIPTLVSFFQKAVAEIKVQHGEDFDTILDKMEDLGSLLHFSAAEGVHYAEVQRRRRLSR